MPKVLKIYEELKKANHPKAEELIAIYGKLCRLSTRDQSSFSMRHHHSITKPMSRQKRLPIDRADRAVQKRKPGMPSS